MVQKEPLPSKCFLITTIICAALFAACGHLQQKSVAGLNYSIDISVVPHDTVLFDDTKLTVANRIYMYNNAVFSGIVKENYSTGVVKRYISVYKGMMYGSSFSYYEDGKVWEIRNYRNNLSTGKHYGYWPESGHPKFEYNYYDDKMEGLQKKWYPSGKPFLFLNYAGDHEEGLQQGWRENGKLYLNYEARDGFRYGLQKTALCYTLKDEKLKSSN